MGLATEVKDRLTARASGPNRPLDAVRLAADAMAAKGELKRPVEAWVLAMDAKAGVPSTATGPVRQQVEETVIVLVGYLYARGLGNAATDPEAVEQVVLDALLGWTPPSRRVPLHLRSIQLLSFDGERGVMFRQLVFGTQRIVTSPN